MIHIYKLRNYIKNGARLTFERPWEEMRCRSAEPFPRSDFLGDISFGRASVAPEELQPHPGGEFHSLTTLNNHYMTPPSPGGFNGIKLQYKFLDFGPVLKHLSGLRYSGHIWTWGLLCQASRCSPPGHRKQTHEQRGENNSSITPTATFKARVLSKYAALCVVVF